MADKPIAEIKIDEELVRRLLLSQAPLAGIDSMRLVHADDGWDCSVWRLGDALAVRIPRRALASPLVTNEQRYLPAIAARLRAVGVGAPAPVFTGSPDGDFPWPWSVVPWFDGTPGLRVPRSRRSGWVAAMAAVLDALHVVADGPYPPNPSRGVPLMARADAVTERLASQRQAADVPAAALDRLAALWADGLGAAAWDGPPTWIHGDLHPGNVIARGGDLVALIDFGDLTAGDPAYDLAIAWLAFDRHARRRFRDATAGRHDEATWIRARAWAASITLMLLEHSDDNPPYAQLGRECLAELTG